MIKKDTNKGFTFNLQDWYILTSRSAITWKKLNVLNISSEAMEESHLRYMLEEMSSNIFVEDTKHALRDRVRIAILSSKIQSKHHETAIFWPKI